MRFYHSFFFILAALALESSAQRFRRGGRGFGSGGWFGGRGLGGFGSGGAGGGGYGGKGGAGGGDDGDAGGGGGDDIEGSSFTLVRGRPRVIGNIGGSLDINIERIPVKIYGRPPGEMILNLNAGDPEGTGGEGDGGQNGVGGAGGARGGASGGFSKIGRASGGSGGYSESFGSAFGGGGGLGGSGEDFGSGDTGGLYGLGEGFGKGDSGDLTGLGIGMGGEYAASGSVIKSKIHRLPAKLRSNRKQDFGILKLSDVPQITVTKHPMSASTMIQSIVPYSSSYRSTSSSLLSSPPTSGLQQQTNINAQPVHNKQNRPVARVLTEPINLFETPKLMKDEALMPMPNQFINRNLNRSTNNSNMNKNTGFLVDPSLNLVESAPQTNMFKQFNVPIQMSQVPGQIDSFIRDNENSPSLSRANKDGFIFLAGKPPRSA